MNYVAFSVFSLIIIVPYNTISLGSFDGYSFSICWKARNNAFDGLDGLWNNLKWMNSTTPKPINQTQFMTLTVSSSVENKVTLKYGDNILNWTFTIPSTNGFNIRRQQKPQRRPINTTQEALELLSPSQVFACENGTRVLHEDENLSVATGYTLRFPIKLESRSPSMLLISWTEDPPPAVAPDDPTARIHSVSLYHAELGAHTDRRVDTTGEAHYRFTALESCTPYVACVEMAGNHPLACLSAITDPDEPRHFQVTSWNSTSLTVAWDSPQNRKYSLFLLTAFHLDGTDHVVEQTSFWHRVRGNHFVFTLPDLEPCDKVKLGLQTVCQAGIDSYYSKMLLVDGNSVNSNIEGLRQASSGPNNYTLTWEVQNTSSISTFRVYHQGALRGSTLVTNHTVDNLEPCQEYRARVEALCGESVVMSTATVTAHTGPSGLSDLQYRPEDSTALWTRGTTRRPGVVSFFYELSYVNGTAVRTGHLTEPALELPELWEGLTYTLSVWEECGGKRQSEHVHVCFDGVNVPLPRMGSFRSRGGGPDYQPLEYEDDELQDLELEVSGSSTLEMVVPGAILNPGSQLRAHLENIVKNKLEELLKGFKPPVRIQVVTYEPLAEKRKTKILFLSFDAVMDDDFPLPVEDLLTHIQSLRSANITVHNETIYWNGPDSCVFPKKVWCPSNSLCNNILDSYTCVCQDGYYDVGSAITPPLDLASPPVCNENGLFSRCLDKLMAGGIAKAYLTGYFKGEVVVVLNDGQCSVIESETFYYFHTSRKASQCGTKMVANETHIEFQNTLTVTLSRDQMVTRRDLKFVLKCVYPRSYVRNTEVNADLEWMNSHSVVQYNSSLDLGLTMALYSDVSYTHSYNYEVELGPKDTLFFQLALETGNFGPEVLLEVVSCWATESAGPRDLVQGLFLQAGCPVDDTFHWLSANGVAQTSRFSVQMFTMSKGVPLYFHCLARICAHGEDCTTNCTTQRLSKRSVSRRGESGKWEAVVSAGPLLVNTKGEPGTRQSSWAEHMLMVSIVAGSVGLLGVTVLGVSATKAILNYYEMQRLQ